MAGFSREKRREVILVEGAMNRNNCGVYRGEGRVDGVLRTVGSMFEWVRWCQGLDLNLA